MVRVGELLAEVERLASAARGRRRRRAARTDRPPDTRLTARLLEGGPIAAEIRDAVAEDVASFTRTQGRPPGLRVVIVGRTPRRPSISSGSCAAAPRSASTPASSSSRARRPRHGHRHASGAERRSDVDGVIVQMPLPPTIRLRAVIDAIDPAKDIDGIHPLNAGLLRLGYDGFLPATAHAAVEILRRSGIEIEGRDAVVIGRSAVVGMPAAFLLVKEDATVTVCHSRTTDLAGQVAPGRHRRRRRRPARPGDRSDAQAGRGRRRCRDQRRRRAPRRRRRLRVGRRGRLGHHARCPAASAR